MISTRRTPPPSCAAPAGRAVAPHRSSRAPASHSQCTDQRAPSRANVIVNLRRAIATAVSNAPVKEVARDYGISPREVSCLRTETGFPRVPIFLEIARRDPALRAQVMAILTGEAEASSPQAIDAVIKRMGHT